MRYILKMKNTYKPHSWFAWYPIKIFSTEEYPSGKMVTQWVWLEKVKREKRSGPVYTYHYHVKE